MSHVLCVLRQTKLAKPLALCPVPKCPSPVLSARDLLMVLPLADYDAYSKRQLDAFNRLMLQVRVRHAEKWCRKGGGAPLRGAVLASYSPHNQELC